MKTILAVVMSTCLVSISVHADSLKLKPGLWETTVTSTNSFSGTTTQTETECVVEAEFDPRTMFKDAEGCELVDNNLSGNTLTYSLVCDVQGTKANIEGMYTTEGDIGSGNMNLEMSFGNQTMTMENSFDARRIGDC